MTDKREYGIKMIKGYLLLVQLKKIELCDSTIKELILQMKRDVDMSAFDMIGVVNDLWFSEEGSQAHKLAQLIQRTMEKTEDKVEAAERKRRIAAQQEKAAEALVNAFFNAFTK